jgi:DNA modification methylase
MKLEISDCLEHNPGPVDYIFTVPPDFDELNLNPARSDDRRKYYLFLFHAFDIMRNVSTAITIGITDRKCAGRIESKHMKIIEYFNICRDWKLKAHKIWVKTEKPNLYRLGYTNIMCFVKEPRTSKNKGEFLKDVFSSPEKHYQGYRYGMNPDVIVPFIREFTNKYDTVYDPMMGSGSTGAAAKLTDRKFIGCDIDSSNVLMASKRLKENPALDKIFK